VQDNLKSGDGAASEPVPVWFPTLALNIDLKRCQLAKNHEWLYSHIHIKSIQNGRMDVEVVILDAEGELVAVASQVAMVMPSARNLAKRNVKQKYKFIVLIHLSFLKLRVVPCPKFRL
jgi:hypothetical protein